MPGHKLVCSACRNISGVQLPGASAGSSEGGLRQWTYGLRLARHHQTQSCRNRCADELLPYKPPPIAVQLKERLTDGTGNFDAEELMHKLPEQLSLSEKKVQQAVKALAKDRRRTTLVQVPSVPAAARPLSSAALLCRYIARWPHARCRSSLFLGTSLVAVPTLSARGPACSCRCFPVAVQALLPWPLVLDFRPCAVNK